MDNNLFEKLYADGVISGTSFNKIKSHRQNGPVSVFWELRTILYAGILLFSGGIGLLIYKNIDSIGHAAVLIFIALVSAGSYIYCFKKAPSFSLQKVAAPNSFFDYILLLGCLTFLSFTGYLQFQYHVFGERYGLALFIPMVVLFFTAYYFDNIAILSLAITNLAAWAGIAVTPAKILVSNDFSDAYIIITGLLLGAVLLFAATITRQKKVKVHFEFTYFNFGMHLLFVSAIAAMIHFEGTYLLWFLALATTCYFFYGKAVKEKSFYILLAVSLYFYFGLSYLIIRFLFDTASMEEGGIYIACLYFIISAIVMLLFLIKMNKKLKV